MNGNGRAAMVPIRRRMRAFFAPYDPVAKRATVFDPARSGVFPLDAPPAPWIDLGWIENLQRSSASITGAVQAGTLGAPAGQFRAALHAEIEFDFRTWGKLQIALASGAEHFNALASDSNADAAPGGGTPIPPIPLLPGSSAGELMLGPGAIDRFAVGDLVAVDIEYRDVTGWVGTGLSAAYVADPEDVKHDPDYVRRVTFNVGRISAKTATSLLLSQSLLGGAPAAGAAVQKVIAFVDREAASATFQEWSALFVEENESGGRVCYHYPHLSATRPASATGKRWESAEPIAGKLAALAIHAAFVAYPYSDDNDGRTVLCYRSYFPAGMAAVY